MAKKYHKPKIKSEKAFDAKTNTGITPDCYCISGGMTSCSDSGNDTTGF